MKIKVSIETSSGYSWDEKEFDINEDYKQDPVLKQAIIVLYKKAKGLESKWQSDGEDVSTFLSYDLLSEKNEESFKKILEIEHHFEEVLKNMG